MMLLACGVENMTQTCLRNRNRLTEKTDFRKGRGSWRGINEEFGISRYKLLYIKQINNKVLLYSTGNYIQYPVIKHNRKEYEKESLYMDKNHFALQQ